MNVLRKVFVLFIMGALLACITTSSASAASGDIAPICSDPEFFNTSTCRDVTEHQDSSSNRFYGPNGLLTKAAGIITYIGGIAAIIMILLGAFTFMTGSGDANSLAAAKKTVVYALAGLVVLVLPSAIIRFVISRL